MTGHHILKQRADSIPNEILQTYEKEAIIIAKLDRVALTLTSQCGFSDIKEILILDYL